MAANHCIRFLQKPPRCHASSLCQCELLPAIFYALHKHQFILDRKERGRERVQLTSWLLSSMSCIEISCQLKNCFKGLIHGHADWNTAHWCFHGNAEPAQMLLAQQSGVTKKEKKHRKIQGHRPVNKTPAAADHCRPHETSISLN